MCGCVNMVRLPHLSFLTINETSCGSSFHSDWLEACGAGRRIPKFLKFGNSNEKKIFRQLVNEAENDRFSVGQYNSPYANKDVDRLIKQRTYSIEHIVPRSFVNGRASGAAEDDFFGWDLADVDANRDRSNLPLVLWKLGDGAKPGRILIAGELHYNPIEEHKPRLARRWIYIRLTYALEDDIAPPSIQQIEHMQEIINVAKVHNPRQRYAENRLHKLLSKRCREKYGIDWKNPLNEDSVAATLLDDPRILNALSMRKTA